MSGYVSTFMARLGYSRPCSGYYCVAGEHGSQPQFICQDVSPQVAHKKRTCHPYDKDLSLIYWCQACNWAGTVITAQDHVKTPKHKHMEKEWAAEKPARDAEEARRRRALASMQPPNYNWDGGPPESRKVLAYGGPPSPTYEAQWQSTYTTTYKGPGEDSGLRQATRNTRRERVDPDVADSKAKQLPVFSEPSGREMTLMQLVGEKLRAKTPHGRKEARRAFMMLDTSGDGRIDADELAVLLQGFNVRLTKYEMLRLMAQYDDDGDGTVGLDEFLTYLLPEDDPDI